MNSSLIITMEQSKIHKSYYLLWFEEMITFLYLLIFDYITSLLVGGASHASLRSHATDSHKPYQLTTASSKEVVGWVGCRSSVGQLGVGSSELVFWFVGRVLFMITQNKMITLFICNWIQFIYTGIPPWWGGMGVNLHSQAHPQKLVAVRESFTNAFWHCGCWLHIGHKNIEK